MPTAQRYIFMVSMDIDPDKEALFNEVYDQEHVPNLLKVPGVHAARRSKAVVARLKSPSQFSLVGTPQRRIDAVAAVTGQKQFALDLDVPNALPTMVCRPPTINGTV